MNSPDYNTDALDRPKTATASTGGYEWTCPYCGDSRLNTFDGEGGRENAITALRTHILASVDGAHGSRNEFPTDGPPEFSDHVIQVEDGR